MITNFKPPFEQKEKLQKGSFQFAYKHQTGHEFLHKREPIKTRSMNYLINVRKWVICRETQLIASLYKQKNNMADKFQHKYRIASARLPGWDYGSNALYFITICTQNREHFFGEIAEGEMRLTTVGQSAYDCWNEIPNHFPFVVIENFVVMPNHVHGIIRIDKPVVETQNIASQSTNQPESIETQHFASQSTNQPESIETQHFASLPNPQLNENKFGPQSKNLASIVRGFKIGVTKFAKSNHIKFAWQPRFHDHIIRNEKSYQNIANYIENNPKNWVEDKFRK